MLSRAPYINEIDVSEEDRKAYERLFTALVESRVKRSLLLQDVFTSPEHHGIKGAIRQEILKVVLNTLQRIGYIGKPEDFRMQSKLYNLLLRRQQEGGMF